MSSLSRPPSRRRVACGYLGRAQRDEMAALVGVAANLRAILAAHVAFKLVNGSCLRPAHDVQRDGLVRVAAKAFNLKVNVARIERVAQRRRGLRGALKAEHALVPGSAR